MIAPRACRQHLQYAARSEGALMALADPVTCAHALKEHLAIACRPIEPSACAHASLAAKLATLMHFSLLLVQNHLSSFASRSSCIGAHLDAPHPPCSRRC